MRVLSEQSTCANPAGISNFDTGVGGFMPLPLSRLSRFFNQDHRFMETLAIQGRYWKSRHALSDCCCPT